MFSNIISDKEFFKEIRSPTKENFCGNYLIISPNDLPRKVKKVKGLAIYACN